MHKPGREISPETNPASTLGLGFEAQNLEKINLLFNSPSVWYFVLAAKAD